MATEINWYTSTLDCGGISYRASKIDDRDSLTIDKVVFSRYNELAGVREEVAVHWGEAFRWADFDPCGGLGLSSVILSDGSKCFASGLYYGGGHPDEYTSERGGLAEVVVGCYGTSWMKRAKRPVRNEGGFPVREVAAA